MLSSSIACLGIFSLVLSMEIARIPSGKIATGSTGGIFGGGWYKNAFLKLFLLRCT